MPVSITNIAIIVLTIVIILFIFYKLFFSKKELSNLQDGNIEKIIPANSFEKNYSSNYAYSAWIYIDDWNYKYGQEKVILAKLNNENQPCPKITLGAFQNDLNVALQTFSTNNVNNQIFNCNVSNIPIQSWVNILISINGRTLDIYLDGKLVKTCVMPGLARIYQSSPLNITPAGGFSGYTANVEYFPNAINPQEAWNIYRKGYGASILGNFVNNYGLKLSILNNNKEAASIQV